MPTTQDLYFTDENGDIFSLTGGGGGGGVLSIDGGTSTFINISGGPITTSGTLIASLSASGIPSSTTFLRGDNSWATIPGGNPGTVTSVSSTTAGNALDVVVTNPTATPDLAFTFAGSDAQYITGAGNLDILPFVTLTTTGTSGAATLSSGVLNIPQYSGGSGTVTSVDGGTSTFINISGGPITTSGTLIASLSASGTPTTSTFLRGDNVWATIPPDGPSYGLTILQQLGSPGMPDTPSSGSGIVWIGDPFLETTTTPTTQDVYFTDENGDIFSLTGDGLIGYETITDNRINAYHLAYKLDLEWRTDETQIEGPIPEINDPLIGGWGLIDYWAKYDKVFGSIGTATPTVIIFDDIEDLTSYTISELPSVPANYGYAFRFIFSPLTEKYYVILGNTSFTQQYIRIYEWDPVTYVWTSVLNYNTGVNQGYSSMCILGSNCYVSNGLTNPKIWRFDMTNWSFVSVITPTTPAGCYTRDLFTDGTSVYHTTIYGATNPMYVYDEDLILQGTSPGYVDYATVTGTFSNWIYMIRNGEFYMVKKGTFDEIKLELDVDVQQQFFDGSYIWVVSSTSEFIRVDPVTLKCDYFDVTDYLYSLSGGTYNFPAVTTDGQRLFVGTYQQGPPEQGGISRFALPYAEIKTIWLDGEGNKKFEISRENNDILMHNLPTSAPATTGSVWNDSGTLKIV